MEDEPTDNYQPFASFEAWAEEACDQSLVERYKSLMQEAATSATPTAFQAALSNVVRTAALETGAVEDLYETNRGITITVAGMAAGWEAQLDEIGSEVRHYFEAQLSAFEMVLDFATKRVPITAAWIRQLHEQITASQSTYRAKTSIGWQELELHHGQYKTQPNTVLQPSGEMHWYAPVIDTEPEVDRLVRELTSDAFNAAPPQLQAAFAHYAFVAIHPFEDGNGRVARALASVYLYRFAGVPLVVFSDMKVRYWAALKAGDNNDRQPFVRFIEDRLVDTLSTVRLLLNSSASQLPTNGALLVQRVLSQPRVRTPKELSLIGLRIHGAVTQVFGQQWGHVLSQVAPAILTTTTHGTRGVGEVPHWDQRYNLFDTAEAPAYEIRMPEPLALSVACRPVLGMASDLSNRQTFMMVDPDRTDIDILYIRADDADPEIAVSLQLQIEGWVGLLTGRVAKDFLQLVHETLN